ncbi:MAG: hypothetical protein A2X12_04975 [Bacteroidetes bacterium GWE2_29_8]|nr:MAG: hypothetical protein A2X12_04975 [Bacteroidetes bacterium GWE2_29_8]OFY20756.1 MAG: hypothetical protein A2X02_09695 [Bacteroidetes bacterium GWF2_29_10]
MKVFFFIFFIFFFFDIESQTINNERKKQLNEINYFKSIKLKEAKTIVQGFSFNKTSGRLQKIEALQLVNKYNKDGLLIEQESYNIETNTISWKAIYKYENNLLIKEYRYNENGKINWSSQIRYDKLNNKTQILCFTSDGKIDQKELYKYDTKGNLIELIFLNPDESVNWKYKYKYDNLGNKIEEVMYSSENEIDESTSYIFDKKGNVLEKKVDNILRNTFKYNEAGNLIEEIGYDNRGKINSKFNLIYNSQNLIIEKRQLNLKNNTFETASKYVYDFF